jgi:hypothetical protein
MDVSPPSILTAGRGRPALHRQVAVVAKQWFASQPTVTRLTELLLAKTILSYGKEELSGSHSWSQRAAGERWRFSSLHFQPGREREFLVFTFF